LYPGFLAGIYAGDSNVITQNNTSNNGIGIICQGNCQLSGNISNHSPELSNQGMFGGYVGVGILVTGADGSLIGNVANGNSYFGLVVTCPSKVDDNTALGNKLKNLSESGAGCLDTNNLAP